MRVPSYHGYRFPPEIISHAVWLYHRDRVEHNGVDLVLVERSDRLARDLLVSEVIVGQFRKLGVRVVDASGTDMERPVKLARCSVLFLSVLVLLRERNSGGGRDGYRDG